MECAVLTFRCVVVGVDSDGAVKLRQRRSHYYFLAWRAIWVGVGVLPCRNKFEQAEISPHSISGIKMAKLSPKIVHLFYLCKFIFIPAKLVLAIER